jgi:hypothetical protein
MRTRGPTTRILVRGLLLAGAIVATVATSTGGERRPPQTHQVDVVTRTEAVYSVQAFEVSDGGPLDVSYLISFEPRGDSVDFSDGGEPLIRVIQYANRPAPDDGGTPPQGRVLGAAPAWSLMVSNSLQLTPKPLFMLFRREGPGVLGTIVIRPQCGDQEFCGHVLFSDVTDKED